MIDRDDVLTYVQKRVSFSTAIFSCSFGILNVILHLTQPGPISLELRITTEILLFVIAGIFLALGFIKSPVVRFIHVLILLLLGLFGTAYGEPGALVGPSFISLAVIYAFQYGFLKERLYLKTTIFVLFFIVFTGFTTIVIQHYTVYNALMTLLISLLLFYLVWIAFTPMLKESEKQQEKLRQDIAENRVFVKLGRNVTGTVHNIRSKLATVRTYGQLMKIATSEEAAEYLAKQEAASADIIAMLENLLANVRAYGDVQMMPCDLNEYVRICLDFKKADLEFKHGVHVTTAFSPEATILGDPKDLATIIESLLDNAQEAMTGRKDRHLSVSTVEERHTIKLTIVDNGPGLHFCDPCRHNNECLTCPEFKIGRSTKEKGSGVGMTLVRESIVKLGADMRIESGPGKGAAVHIWFPRFKEIAKELEAV